MADNTANNGFELTGGGAALGNPNISRQAFNSGANQPTPAIVTAPSSTPSAPPPKANDAPTKGSNNVFNGLTEALNQHQKRLEKQYPGYVADEYVIEFADSVIKDAKVTKPNLNVYKNTAGKNVNTAADKLDSRTDSVNTNSQIWEVLAGTQIVQLIDQVVRSSTYITSQQNGYYDKDGKWIPNPKNGTKTIAWYKINISSQALKYDQVRRDFAYRITYTISPYAINQMISPYFSDSKYRGTHKVYNYWFTGLNTQIINYEQEYNQAYYTTLSGKPGALAVPVASGRDQIKAAYMATPEQRTQGQANYTNDPSDSASSFLYSVADFAEVRMKIVGDPAWMQQGEVGKGVSAKTFDYRPFNADGGINYDSQQVTFSVSFNRPTDYDLSKGIMTQNTPSTIAGQAGPAQETVVFIAKTCRNSFSKGEFTQDLVGSLLPLKTSAKANPNTRAPANTVTTSSNTRTNRTAEQIVAEQNASFEYNTIEGSEQTRMLAEQDAGLFDDTSPSPQPASPPEEPTSSGDISLVTLTDDPIVEGVNSYPQIIAKDDA